MKAEEALRSLRQIGYEGLSDEDIHFFIKDMKNCLLKRLGLENLQIGKRAIVIYKIAIDGFKIELEDCPICKGTGVIPNPSSSRYVNFIDCNYFLHYEKTSEITDVVFDFPEPRFYLSEEGNYAHKSWEIKPIAMTTNKVL